MERLVEAYKVKDHTVKSHPPTLIAYPSGSSGKFVAQIRNGAKYDLFFSADQKYPEALVKDQLAVKGSQFTYAIGSLVLWSKDSKFVDSKGEALKKLQFKHLAIANPDLAPYGAAAKEVLQKLYLWEKITPQLVMGENIEQTAHFIQSGNAELGFIAASTAKILPGSKWIVPQHLYTPINQDVVILSHGKDNPSVKDFLQFMKSKEAKKIIEQFGYHF